MLKIAFITCSDLSRYFVSEKNPHLTHDDQLAFDDLVARGFGVEIVIWGSSVNEIVARQFDVLIVRSPWDYMDNEEKRKGFLEWIDSLKSNNIRVANDVDILKWSLDKHYLRELDQVGISVVTTQYLEPQQSAQAIEGAFRRWGRVVVKPCIAAAAKDAFLIQNESELNDFVPMFERVRGDRAFMLQPFIEEIGSQGEWSLVFLNEQYSHAVLKKPKQGGWLVQDELGGSVQSAEPPEDIRSFGEDAFAKLTRLLQMRFSRDALLLYARVDVLPGLHVGELELVEPELFFLDRKTNRPNQAALEKFYHGIMKIWS